MLNMASWHTSEGQLQRQFQGSNLCPMDPVLYGQQFCPASAWKPPARMGHDHGLSVDNRQVGVNPCKAFSQLLKRQDDA
jgi:hypothetical protein